MVPVQSHTVLGSMALNPPLPVPPACPLGTFGLQCNQLCHCPPNITCHPTSGMCSCAPGRIGSRCEAGEWAQNGGSLPESLPHPKDCSPPPTP